MIDALNDLFDHVHAATWVIILTFIASCIAGMWKLRKELKPLLKDTRDFFGDWKGVPDRPGRPGYSGAMKRISDVEHELKANGGGSIKDQVNRLEFNQEQQAKILNLMSDKLGVEFNIEPAKSPPPKDPHT